MKALVGQRQEFARDLEEDQLQHDEGPDRAVLEEFLEVSGFMCPSPHAIGDQSFPRLAAMSSQTARMMMTQVTTNWT
jgi:hypothetical protein